MQEKNSYREKCFRDTVGSLRDPARLLLALDLLIWELVCFLTRQLLDKPHGTLDVRERLETSLALVTIRSPFLPLDLQIPVLSSNCD